MTQDRAERIKELQATIQKIGTEEASILSGATGQKKEYFADSMLGATTDSWELTDIARTLVNALPSAVEGVKGLGNLAMSVATPQRALDTTKALGSMGLGAIIRGAEVLSGDKLKANENADEYKSAFKHFINHIDGRYGTTELMEGDFSGMGSKWRQTFVNDPVGFLLDMAPLKAGLVKGLGKAGVTMSSASPLRGATGRIMETMGHKGAQLAEEFVPNVMSMSTGLPPETFRTAVSAGAKNPLEALTGRFKRKLDPDESMTELESFYRAMTEQKKGKDGREPFHITELSNAVDEAAGAIQSRASANIGPAKAGLNNKSADVSGLMDKLDAYAEKNWGVVWKDGKLEATRSSGVPGLPQGQQQFLKKVFAELEQYRPYQSPKGRLRPEKLRNSESGFTMAKDFDLYDLHSTLVAIDGFAPKSPRGFKIGNAAWSGAREIARKHLDDLDADWGKHSRAYSNDMSMLRDITMTFGEIGGNPTTRIAKILRTMGENPSSEFMRDISKIVSERSGFHLAEAAAGSALSKWIPSGIHGKAVAFAAVSGGAILNPASIFISLPATIPRLMGNLSTKLGAGAAAGRKIQKWGEKLREAVPPEWLELGLSVATIVTRMLEEGREVPPFPDFTDTKSRVKKGLKK